MSLAEEREVQPRRREVEYPISDGKPMAESDKHADLMVYLKEALREHFRECPEVYVSGNNFLYWEEGNPRACVSPDVYVVFGVGMRQRDYYKSWEEGGKLPDVVLEITSKTTREEDSKDKLHKYRDILQVPEYFQFDPTGDYLKPRLQGYRLIQGEYVPMELVDGRLHSDLLGVDLVQEGDSLRLVNPQTGERYLSPRELHQARTELEAELARLRAELATLRGTEADAG